jgi:hypothetical protein
MVSGFISDMQKVEMPEREKKATLVAARTQAENRSRTRANARDVV